MIYLKGMLCVFPMPIIYIYNCMIHYTMHIQLYSIHMTIIYIGRALCLPYLYTYVYIHIHLLYIHIY